MWAYGGLIPVSEFEIETNNVHVNYIIFKVIVIFFLLFNYVPKIPALPMVISNVSPFLTQKKKGPIKMQFVNKKSCFCLWMNPVVINGSRTFCHKNYMN